MRFFITSNLFLLILCVSITVTGCAAPDRDKLKTEIDDQVYNIIDAKWEDSFGSKANYKVSDVTGGPDDIKTSRTLSRKDTTLTLPRTVSIATANNREYQLEKELLYQKALDLRLARHEFEPWFFGTGEAGYLKDGADEAVEGQGSLGVQKMFATGAQIGLNVSLAWIDVLTGNADGGLSRIFSATIAQPLMRGSDKSIVLENLTQAQRDMLYQIRSFNRYRKAFVVTIITQYYEVLLAYDEAQNAQANYKTLVDVYEWAKKLADVGRLPLFELDQARQDMLTASDDYIAAQKIYEQTLDELKITLGLPTETPLALDVEELEILRAAEMPMPGFSEDESIDAALGRRLDFANATDAIDDSQRKILLALDNMRSDLKLVATTENKGGASDPVTLGKAKDTAFVGLQLDLNLDTVAEENEFRSAMLVLNQQRREYERLMDTIVLEIRRAYRDMAEAAERYKVQSQGLLLAKQRFENTMSLLEYGRANTRDVLDARRDLLRAQNATSEALVSYTVAMLGFYRDAEVLQVRPDGMWQL